MGDKNLIEHVVVVMLENRSFDHYLGALNFDPAYPHRNSVDGLKKSAIVNRTLGGVEVPPYCMDGMTLRIDDPPHEWPEVQAQRNGGSLDQFVTAYQQHYIAKGKPLSEEHARRVMGYYSRVTLPVIYALADRFAVCDRWYSSFLGSTWPNRVFLHAGDCGDTILTGPKAAFKSRPRPVWDLWEDPDAGGKKIDWRVYGADFSTLLLWPRFLGGHGSRTECVPKFKEHCRDNKLAQVSIIEPPYCCADDHPEHQPQRGQAFIKYIVEAVAQSPVWEKTAILVTYDEHGGFFDHVDPPARPGDTRGGPFERLGFRVPALIVSPYTPSRVVHQQFDHTSFIASIADRWGLTLPAGITGTPFWDDCFDFDKPPRPGSDVAFPTLMGRDPPESDAIGPPPAPPTDLEEAFDYLRAEAVAKGQIPTDRLEDPSICLFSTLKAIPDLRKDFEPRPEP